MCTWRQTQSCWLVHVDHTVTSSKFSVTHMFLTEQEMGATCLGQWIDRHEWGCSVESDWSWFKASFRELELEDEESVDTPAICIKNHNACPKWTDDKHHDFRRHVGETHVSPWTHHTFSSQRNSVQHVLRCQTVPHGQHSSIMSWRKRERSVHLIVECDSDWAGELPGQKSASGGNHQERCMSDSLILVKNAANTCPVLLPGRACSHCQSCKRVCGSNLSCWSCT